MSPPLRIRKLLDQDYPALAAIFHEVFPERPALPEQIREDDQRRPPHAVRERWVAELEGTVVGSAVLTHHFYFYDPRQFVLNIWVRPAFRDRGVGSALYEAISNGLSAHAATRASCPVMENQPEGLRFLEKRGFCEDRRNFQSLLDLNGYDVGWVEGRVSELRARGVTIARVRELGLTEGRRREIYELQALIDRDAPGSDRRPTMSLEGFWEGVTRDLPDHEPFFVALNGSKMVGMHFGFMLPEMSNRFHIALTGVLGSHRRLGLATVLRGLGIRYAKERGCSQVSTWNDSRNAPILAMNEKFGFKRQLAAVSMERNLA